MSPTLRRRQLNNLICLWLLRASWGLMCVECFRQVARHALQ